MIKWIMLLKNWDVIEDINDLFDEKEFSSQ